MTLSAPPEQTLREPLDRPGDPPSRRIARTAGVLFIEAVIPQLREVYDNATKRLRHRPCPCGVRGRPDTGNRGAYCAVHPPSTAIMLPVT